MNRKNIILIVLGILVIAGLGFYFFKGRGSYNTVTNVSSPTTGPTSAQPTAAGSTIVAQNFSFSPASLTVKAGATVTFTNNDSVSHTMVSNDGTSFNTGQVAGGTSTTFTAPAQVGTYLFHCGIHPSMTATLIVQ